VDNQVYNQISFAEYMTATSNSPNLTKDESLASYIDGEPVYEGIRKLNVINWLLAENVEG
jgi:hypothetical protein